MVEKIIICRYVEEIEGAQLVVPVRDNLERYEGIWVLIRLQPLKRLIYKFGFTYLFSFTV